MKPRERQIDPAKLNALKEYAKGEGLVAALADRAVNSTFGKPREFLWKELTKLYSKHPALLSPKEFFCQELEEAFTLLAGREMAEKVPYLAALCLEGQFSDSPWRRSYRSKYFAFYLERVVNLLCHLIRQSCYRESVKEALFCLEYYHASYEYLLALEIRRGDGEIISLIHEALSGDNSRIILNWKMIHAIVISGHEGLLDGLIRLLLAARLQEGLRQQILEAVDRGKTEVLIRFLQLCIEKNLFRYSSTIRAFCLWTGLEYRNDKPAEIRKYAVLAYECLTDEARRQACLHSENNIEAYFALRAQGCHELAATRDTVTQLLEDPRHYRRVLGWLFITRSDNSLYRMSMASRYLEERDEELVAWIAGNLARTHSLYKPNWSTARDSCGQSVPNPALPGDAGERRALFARLKTLASFIGGKTRSFSGNPFAFVTVTLSSEPVYDCMIALAGYDMDRELVEELLTLAPNMTVDQRRSLICAFLLPEERASHRSFLQSCLSDRSVLVKELAARRLADCRLTEEDVNILASSLRSKSSSLRALVLEILRRQRTPLLQSLLSKMLASEEENQFRAAIELLTERKESHPELLEENRSALAALRQKPLATQTQILLDQLLPEETAGIVYSPENGYGLYDPKAIEAYLAEGDGPTQRRGLLPRLFGGNDLLSPRQIKALLPTEEELDRLLTRVGQVFARHANDELEVLHYDGSRRRILFGDAAFGILLPAKWGIRSLHSPDARLDMIPFWEELRGALEEYTADVKKMLGLFYRAYRIYDFSRYGNHGEPTDSYRSLAKLGLDPGIPQKLGKKHPHFDKACDLFEQLYQLFDTHEVFVEAVKIYRSMIAILGEEQLSRPYLQLDRYSDYLLHEGIIKPIGINCPLLLPWRDIIRRLKLSTEDLAAWFSLEYHLERQIASPVSYSLRWETYFRAYQEKLIPADLVTAYLLEPHSEMPYKIRELTLPKRREIYQKYPFAQEPVSRVIDRIVSIEEKRGELPTPLTKHCLAIERFEGARHFCSLLAALGKENFFRGYEYSQNTTKQAVLSRLLKRCYPAPDDTPQKLAALLKATDIGHKRLAEAVMYAPQWAGFAEEILGWPGLKCGVWFFHAHINETFSAEKETETALYSPITPQQFNDGAFDKNWFLEAYGKLGESRFRTLYNSAKYITTGSNQHRRSQLYSDAVLGRLDTGELMREIREKRNQEKLRCYPLLPIPQGDAQEALRRYEFIQNFLKEGKQFGAQRRDSEKKACNTALENLAITTGVMDVNRLVWQMESRKIREMQPLTEPVFLDGICVRLAIDKEGETRLAMEKNGKPLKALPKSLIKNEYCLELKATVKELKELKRRSVESLERAMVECTEFGAAELSDLCGNPILAPALGKLVWTDGRTEGFLRQTAEGLMLVQPDGISVLAGTLRLAHPHDLKAKGSWTNFMSLLYEQQLVQPFKQVFREYYPITEDERRERTVSRRYAGHQVQPRRTIALLKGRGWTVDYEEGLQKVFYKENLIVRMYALADWFSPAEIEAPTLETVEFFDRGTGKNVPLKQVPPILFSETMRDLDLVVSVANVGGADPEASHSTVEMRTAIAAELVRLLKLSNVSWIGSHAKICGTLASYSVHMGSGVVHAEGIGMVSILPVHSQVRGRIFLPFADDDPKTAEILSKILLLAEDQKLKDPSILRQLTH